ncbi:Uncharacterised protein [Vibrio cholerae]|nr:Uncharacterised protein [Vibrio cholerae]
MINCWWLKRLTIQNRISITAFSMPMAAKWSSVAMARAVLPVLYA